MALANALNEVCHGSQMNDTEFEIRIRRDAAGGPVAPRPGQSGA